MDKSVHKGNIGKPKGLFTKIIYSFFQSTSLLSYDGLLLNFDEEIGKIWLV
jgi:hypothetical protein